MRVIIAIGLLLASVAQAEIYKTYDENGNVIFTDVPSSTAEKIEAKPIATVPALAPSLIKEKTKPINKEKDTAPTAYKIILSGLEAQATIPKEQEPFQAGIHFEPPLHKNHILVVALDGQDLGKNNFAPKIDPTQLDRGQHRLDIKIVDKAQKIIHSEVIDFFIHQTSVVGKKK